MTLISRLILFKYLRTYSKWGTNLELKKWLWRIGGEVAPSPLKGELQQHTTLNVSDLQSLIDFFRRSAFLVDRSSFFADF